MEKNLLKLNGNGPHQRPGHSTSITVEDMHLAVSKIQERHIRSLLLAKYGGDDSERPVIVNRLKSMFLSHRRWNMALCERLVSNALEEYLRPRTCKTCNGSGKRLTPVKGKGVMEVDCEACSGNGILPFSKRERARRMQVSAPTWNNYQAIYQYALDTLKDWNLEGVRFVRARIS